MTPQQASREPRHRASGASERCLKRSDAAGFAAAFSFDADFASPGAGTSREIVLERPRHLRVVSDADGWTEATDAPPRQVVVEVADAWTDAEPARWDDEPSADARALAPAPRRDPRPRREPRTIAERAAHTGDRIALWAVFLGIMLVVIAAASSSAQAGGF